MLKFKLGCYTLGRLRGGDKLVGRLCSPCFPLGLGRADRWPGIVGPRVFGRGLGRWERSLLSLHALFPLPVSCPRSMASLMLLARLSR